ncbi:MAG: hypothetical protein H0W88_04485 [Parachlamydiaceae bacterium]|nr:hypothetical protein [Parachlamydiaceae bacterium]
MNKIYFMHIFLALSLTTVSLNGEEIVVRTNSGDTLTLEIDPEMPFNQVINQIENVMLSFHNDQVLKTDDSYFVTSEQDVKQSNSYSQMVLDFFGGNEDNKKPNSPRNYQKPVSDKEKADIRYIVTTLAKSSWLQLLKEKSSLDRAGDRIDHIHPLRFLMCVFTDEELKSGFHAIKGNGGKVWNEFFGGLSKSLDQESKRDNMSKEDIQDFANTLKIKVGDINDPIQKRRWNDLASALVKLLPRTGNHGRYDQ